MAFFFINKTATSTRLTRSETDEASAIQHFVQKGRKRARKVKLVSFSNAHAFQPPTIVRVGKHAAKDTVNKASKDSGSDSDDSTHENHPKATKDEVYAFANDSTDKQVDATDELSEQTYNSESFSIPCQMSSSICHGVDPAIDPFQASSIKVDDTARSLILYYTNVYHPTVWPNEASAVRDGRTVFQTQVNHIVQESIRDSLSMYCLLTASLCRARYVDKVSIITSPNQENQYMSQALSHMQSRIDSAAAQPGTNLLYLLGPIIFLSAAEGYRDNTRASHVHLKACVDLLAYHGMTVADVDNVNIQGQLLMSDLFLSCVGLHSCLFSSDFYDPGPVSVLDLQPKELKDSSPELNTLATSLLTDSTISSEVRMMVSRIKEIYTTKRSLNTASMNSDRALKTAHWVTKRAMAVRNILLSAFPPPPSNRNDAKAVKNSAPSTPEENLDRAIRVALIQFTLLSMNITGLRKTVKLMACHLQKFMAPLLPVPPGSPPRNRLYLLLWLLVIGYSCAQENTETERWFAEQCLTLIDLVLPPPLDEEDADDWEPRFELLEYAQRSFFYHAPVQGPRLRNLLETAATDDFSSSGSEVVIAVSQISPRFKTPALFHSYKYKLVG